MAEQGTWQYFPECRASLKLTISPLLPTSTITFLGLQTADHSQVCYVQVRGMSQLTNGGNELDRERLTSRHIPSRRHEAEIKFEASSHDATKTIGDDSAPLRLDLLTSYIDAARRDPNYVKEWLYRRTDSNSSGASSSPSPKTVIAIGPSPEIPELDVGARNDPKSHPDNSVEAWSDFDEATIRPIHQARSAAERPLRPRSQSRSREDVCWSPRSQRPRSPSPVRQRSEITLGEDDIAEALSEQRTSDESAENSLPLAERPRRPRSPSLERDVNPKNGSSYQYSHRVGRSSMAQENGNHDLSPGSTQDLTSPAARAAGDMLFNDNQTPHISIESESPTYSLGSLSTLSFASPTKPTRHGPHSHTEPRSSSMSTGASFESDMLASLNDDGVNGFESRRSSDDDARAFNMSPIEAAPSPPPFVPMPPPSPAVTLPFPPPMMPAVVNIARSLAGARPPRRFSEPQRVSLLRSRAAQANADNNTNIVSRNSYTDSSTQTTDDRDKNVKSPRTSGHSIVSTVSSAYKGTQTTERSSQSLSATSSDSFSEPSQRQRTSSCFATQRDSQSHSSTSSLRHSLVLARSEPSPKKPAPNAKSTRLSRILVNPEALSFMQVPHETHEEHIVVHRILSRDEIMDLAELTMDIREARSKGAEARERMWEQWRATRYNHT